MHLCQIDEVGKIGYRMSGAVNLCQIVMIGGIGYRMVCCSAFMSDR